jgi:hypothetical protein
MKYLLQLTLRQIVCAVALSCSLAAQAGPAAAGSCAAQCAQLTLQYQAALREALAERAMPNDHPPQWMQAPSCRTMLQLADALGAGDPTDYSPRGADCSRLRAFAYAQQDCRATPERCWLQQGPAAQLLARCLQALWAQGCAYPSSEAQAPGRLRPPQSCRRNRLLDLVELPASTEPGLCWENLVPTDAVQLRQTDCSALAMFSAAHRHRAAQEPAFVAYREAPQCRALAAAKTRLQHSGCTDLSSTDVEPASCQALRAAVAYHTPYCERLPSACEAHASPAWQAHLQAEHVLVETGCREALATGVL